ncbi:MAG TPA: M14 family zinc carboxypeptidase [Ignavibacteriaceae bacterium]|nr:M14 family zinc carboxypeptidase [Ignavibacteriaceae bacterium]
MLKFISILIIFFSMIISAQDLDFLKSLDKQYDSYFEKSINKRRFKHSDLKPLITSLENKKYFTVKKAGLSAENREIYLLSWGNGPVKVFLWSQMHGDEPTATMALLDIFNFVKADDSFNDFRNLIRDKLTIYFMPMVNPDGAEIYQRRNMFEIDINRDAVRKQTPEGELLMGIFDSLKADFGFNLHDQSTRYSVGNSSKPATLSFLAPTINYEKSISPAREDAIKLISGIFRNISDFIPGHIAKYSDDFEPRAFGDNFQKKGTRTILIESGGYKNDPEKQFIRKMNFLSILYSFKSIAEQGYKKEDPAVYEKIPFNEKYIIDLILRNLTYKNSNYEYLIDIGINNEEQNYNEAKDFYYKSLVEDMGDLSVFYGYDELDLKGMEIIVGKTYPKSFKTLFEIKKLNFSKLYNEGYTNVVLNEKISEGFTKLPINIFYKTAEDEPLKIKIGKRANFIIKQNNEVKYVIINGFVLDPQKPEYKTGNALIIK